VACIEEDVVSTPRRPAKATSDDRPQRGQAKDDADPTRRQESVEVAKHFMLFL
jgi:hypothetical protein